MSDYISREALKNAIHADGNLTAYTEYIINRIPSADVVEQKHGKWIEHEDGWRDPYYDCSACGESWTTIDGTPQQNGMNFCPNCGARMDGANDV